MSYGRKVYSLLEPSPPAPVRERAQSKGDTPDSLPARRSASTVAIAALALVAIETSFGQGYMISTVVGAGWDIPGLSANLSQLEGLAADYTGNVEATWNIHHDPVGDE
ncbi:MAG TPA: hypothetical protein VGG72_09590 [Bryobacteraceae bacterium]